MQGISEREEIHEKVKNIFKGNIKLFNINQNSADYIVDGKILKKANDFEVYFEVKNNTQDVCYTGKFAGTESALKKNGKKEVKSLENYLATIAYEFEFVKPSDEKLKLVLGDNEGIEKGDKLTVESWVQYKWIEVAELSVVEVKDDRSAFICHVSNKNVQVPRKGDIIRFKSNLPIPLPPPPPPPEWTKNVAPFIPGARMALQSQQNIPRTITGYGVIAGFGFSTYMMFANRSDASQFKNDFDDTRAKYLASTDVFEMDSLYNEKLRLDKEFRSSNKDFTTFLIIAAGIGTYKLVSELLHWKNPTKFTSQYSYNLRIEPSLDKSTHYPILVGISIKVK